MIGTRNLVDRQNLSFLAQEAFGTVILAFELDLKGLAADAQVVVILPGGKSAGFGTWNHASSSVMSPARTTQEISARPRTFGGHSRNPASRSRRAHRHACQRHRWNMRTSSEGPFGEVIRVSGSQAAQNPFRFSTKFTDDESGLVYYGYRYYNASMGRWVSRDPLEERAGINLYSACRNHPNAAVDGLGLAEVDCKACDNCRGKKDIAPQINERLRRYKTGDEVFAGEGAATTRPNVLAVAIIEDWAEGLPEATAPDIAKSKYQGSQVARFLNKCVLVCGHCIGTDKLGHIFQQGKQYQDLDAAFGPGTGEKFGKWSEGVGQESDYPDHKHFPPIKFGQFGLLADGVVSHADLAANTAGHKLYNDIKKGKFKSICDYVTEKLSEESNPNEYHPTHPALWRAKGPLK